MRHRLIGWILVCLFSTSIFAARYSANSPSLRVNESATKFSIKKEGAVVSLAIENSGTSPLTARVKLELIDPREAVRATAARLSRRKRRFQLLGARRDRPGVDGLRAALPERSQRFHRR